ncbi:alcohol dehydrogenase-like 3 [Vigna radiata var. radiata]|uniref:Alcohol dehydrogenase-like 3 n=1 Tax=Vigna radiata var. radiata TaxID=3916 RepID=A0A1S3VBE1_VIGRR|nr:alcohol dehydrogenase-like 3 [Vigna radiata var. radiata]
MKLLSRIVENVEEGVNEMKEGDLVVLIFNGECGDCKYYMSEKTNKCERCGYTVLDSACVVKIHANGDWDFNPFTNHLA